MKRKTEKRIQRILILKLKTLHNAKRLKTKISGNKTVVMKSEIKWFGHMSPVATSIKPIMKDVL